MMLQNKDDLCFPQLNSSCKKPTLHWSKAVLLNSVLSFICLITVALNLIVIISVSHFRQLHTPTNIILLSLAVSDFLVGFFLMPLEIFRVSSCWLLGDNMCVLMYYMMCQITSASIANIVFISVDRYIAICDPLHYPTRITLAKVKCCICLFWLSSASCSFFYIKDELIQPGRSRSCFGECKVLINSIVGTFDLIVNFICSVTVIIILYMRVFVVAVSQAYAMRSHITAAALQKSDILKTKKSMLKAARTLGVLVFVFLLCYCPCYCVFFALSDVLDPSSMIYTIFSFYINSCLNPVIYTLFYPWFRKSIKIIVTLQILRPGSCETKIL